MNSFMTKVKAFLLLVGANPIFQWVYKVGRDSAIAYYGSAPFAPTKQWAVGLGVAIASGLVHAFDIWILQQLANGTAPAAPSVAPTPVAPAAPTPVNVKLSHIGMLKSQLKMSALLIGVSSLLASSAFAWDVPGKAFGFKNKLTTNMGTVLVPSASGENDLVLLPTGSLGFGVGDPNPSYGFSLAYDMVLGRVNPVDAGTSSLMPYLGVGVAGYVDAGPWITSGLSSPVLADFGVNLIGPQINGLVPSGQIVWNLDSGKKTMTVNMTVPFAPLSDALIVKVLGL